MSLAGKTLAGSIDHITEINAYIVDPTGKRTDFFKQYCDTDNLSIKFDSFICKKIDSETYNVTVSLITSSGLTNKFKAIGHYMLKKKTINVIIFSYNDIDVQVPPFFTTLKDVLVDSNFIICECPKKKGTYSISGTSKITDEIVLLPFGTINYAFNSLLRGGNLKFQ